MARRLTMEQKQVLRKEADVWDQLSDQDFARLFDHGRPIKQRLRRPPPKTLTINLDEKTLNLLKRVARQKQISYAHLAAMWIAERLGREQQPSGELS